MASNRQTAVAAQLRDQGSRRFRASYSDDELWEILREVALAVSPQEPTRLTQLQFDTEAPSLLALQGKPPPPSARAIYGRMSADKDDRRSWREILETAVTLASVAHTIAVAVPERAEPSWFDESHVFYGLRRVGLQLGRKPDGKDTIRPSEYDRARCELLAAERPLQRGQLLEKLLPTAAQIETIAGELGWEGACELAGFAAPTNTNPLETAPLQLIAHYYETQRRLPTRRSLQRYASAHRLPLPRKIRETGVMQAWLSEFVASRAARGLETPPDGPAAGEELTAGEVDALLEGLPRFAVQPKGHWEKREHVVAALAEYVELFDGKQPLRQKHYFAHRQEHRWPTLNALAQHGRFQELIAEARKLVRGRERGNRERGL